MTLITRRNALKLGLAGGAFALTTPSQALVEIVVTGGNFTPLPIAIPDFASSDPAFGKEIADIVRANLKRSGLFVPLDPASLPIKVGDVTNEPDFASWRAASVDALVMGSVERAGEVSSQVRVWDTQASAQVVGKSLSTDAANYRRIAHIVSDAIYASLAGGSGYFDTRVLYVAESGPKANRVKRLAIMDQDGANIQYLTSGKSLTLGPRISPSGDSLAFTSYDGGNPQVYLAAIGGSSQAADRQCTDVVCPALFARWRHGGVLGQQWRNHQYLPGGRQWRQTEPADQRRSHRYLAVLLPRWFTHRLRKRSWRQSAALHDGCRRRRCAAHLLW